MPFALFKNENLATGLPQTGQFQVGVSNADSAGLTIERGVGLPFASDAQASWVYYDIALEWLLDSGIVVHRRLPQVDNAPDILGSCDITDPDLDKMTGRGVNLLSKDKFQDVVQRMAHSRYYLHMWGQAMRVGQQVPIPSALKLSGGVKLVPHDANPQRAFNRISGNYSGAILWHAQWSSWYTLASPPTAKLAPTAPNPGLHIDASVPTPSVFQAPFSQPDDEAERTLPGQVIGLQMPIR